MPLRVLLGVSLVCFANLLLEVVLTRIFSATMYYHFTFLAISLALLGMGASGVYVYVRADKLGDDVEGLLARWARIFAVSTVVALAYVLANPMEIVTGSSDVPKFTNRTLLQLLFLNGLTAFPFFSAGVVVALAVQRYRESINRVYFWDLAGAALAALAAGLLIRVFGGPALVVAAGLCAATAGVLFAPRSRRGHWAVGLLASLLVLALGSTIFAVPPLKGVKAGKLVFEEWNTFSRVTVQELKDGRLDVKIDASAATRVVRPNEAMLWKWDVTAFAHYLPEGRAKDVLIIGPGAGRDVAHALAAGAERVTGVEVNPIIAETIMKDRFRAESGDLYFDPRVKIVVDEGRSFVRRSRERYDLIQASFVDTWAATSAGAFALTENALYTLEAFDDYFEHLTDGGAVTMTRWASGTDPESLRLVVLAAGALERRGVPPGKTRGHLYVVTKDGLATLIVKRNPLTEAELDRLDGAAAMAGYGVTLSPRTAGSSPAELLVDAGAFSEDVAHYGQEVSPPTDDRPFFFYFIKTSDLLSFRGHVHADAPLSNPGLWVLSAFGLTLLVLTVGFIFVPLIVHRRSDLRGSGAGPRRALGLVYFGLIGLAFMTVEIALMQKFSLFLGHPSYALLVVLFSILVGTALGARLSGRLAASRPAATVIAAAAAVAGLALAATLILPPALRSLVAWPPVARILLAGGTVAVFGLLMGVMLPIGVTLLARRDPAVIAWGWGINGGASVIATVGATVLAIHAGFTTTLAAGGALYVLAGLAGGWLAALTASR